MRTLILYSSLLFVWCCGLAADAFCVQAPSAATLRPGAASVGAADAAGGAEPEKLSAAYYYNRANYAISREMYADALNEIDRGMDLDPGFLPFITQKALVLSHLSRYEDAARFYALALEARPDDARLAALAVENMRNNRAGNSAALSADLVKFFSRISAQATPELLKLLAERQDQNHAVFLPSLRAADAAGKLTDKEQAVLKACLANNAAGRSRCLLPSGGGYGL